jgi:hypothetical protein
MYEFAFEVPFLTNGNWAPVIGQQQRGFLLSINRTQSRVVIGLLTGQNTLRRHLYVMRLSNNPTCRKCGTEGETSVHILCECEPLASLRHSYLGSFFLDPADIRKLSTGAIWNFGKEQGSFNLVSDYGAQVLRPRFIGPGRAGTQIPFIHSFIHSFKVVRLMSVWISREAPI